VGGVSINKTQFCSGVNLTFLCTLRISNYLWVIEPVLTGFSGRIAIERDMIEEETKNGITLTAQGDGDFRRSTLALVASIEWNGDTIVCSDSGNKMGDKQNTTVFIWG